MNSRCPFSEMSVKPRESTVIFIFRFNAYHLGGGGGGGVEVLAIMAYTGRFRLEGILFSGFRYMKEPGCYY